MSREPGREQGRGSCGQPRVRSAYHSNNESIELITIESDSDESIESTTVPAESVPMIIPDKNNEY
ncbi:hypothetical protein BLOT_011854 [Blomia tropicalis]|nr:hypothetical protein BLOT_011854 [Blomia tropicalis]